MKPVQVKFAEGLDQAVVALEAMPSFPGPYAARVRAAVRRLDPLPPDPLNVSQALSKVSHQARIDVDAPLRSRRPGARVAKVAVKRATAWYLRYVADQVGDLGQAMVAMGVALAQRLEAVQAQMGDTRAATEAEIELLRARVAALEARVAEPATTAEATETEIELLQARFAALEALMAEQRATRATAQAVPAPAPPPPVVLGPFPTPLPPAAPPSSSSSPAPTAPGAPTGEGVPTASRARIFTPRESKDGNPVLNPRPDRG